MTRTKLRNIFLQNRSEENRMRYRKQRNFCVSLSRKTKNRYYENLNEKSNVDNKVFWKTVKPLLSYKVAGIDKIHLIENNELVKTDLETAEVLNNFFSNTVQNLDISRYSNDEPYYLYPYYSFFIELFRDFFDFFLFESFGKRLFIKR